jgi:hypothetical protein
VDTRTATLIGGPSGGTHPRITGRVGHICTRTGTGPWQLYRHAGADRYVHAGPCDNPNHMHSQPGADGCCCGDPNCRDREDRFAAMGIDPGDVEQVEFSSPLR